jgi:peptide/nickel transport system substrate-binding protein
VPTSWRASRDVDRIEIIVVPDPATRLQNLLSGGTDIANAIDPDQIPTIKAAGFGVSVIPGPMALGIALRTADDAAQALKDRRVRWALNLAIDRDTITEHLLLNTMQPATQFAAPDVLGFDPSVEPFTFDLERARRLLADAGYAAGFKLKGYVVVGQFPGDALIFQQVVRDLQTIGVQMELRTLPFTEFSRRQSEREWAGTDFHSALISHYRLGDISQAAETLSCLDERSSFCDPAMATLIAESHKELNPDARERALKTINARFQYHAPVLLITRYASINALSKRILTLSPVDRRNSFWRDADRQRNVTDQTKSGG